ncbi:Alpha-pyrone synthesis polyketide synthase-like Pks18 [Pirellulimonas nuda]|uniref:Alpha-pyrone synthesis polyketide synthase-like Pks18 n=1 Tax=Pirellulimonas nuda TaxID=2528009 RepID=A0A518D9T9_9BACT|nr:type III polyketide synthase [Pirellulimonas nuda]QDU88244.1 Alpha-pyrone synthesis polyketide synthase-like Pks18 [Pirellulimonas nuda]
MSFQIAGVGSAVPAHTLSADTALEMVRRLCCETPKQARLAEMLYRRSGVDTRATCVPPESAYQWEAAPNGPTLAERMALYEQHAAPLAAQSATAALQQADCPPSRVRYLVTVSCTGFEAPGVDLALVQSLGLSPGVERVNVGFMGCHGAINGLRVVRGLAAADPGAVILLVATELCSLHYAYGWDPERLVGNALFADGSAALVGAGRPAQPPRQEACGWRLKATGSQVLPNSADLMKWRVRDHGFEMALSAELPGLVEKHLAGWLTGWLESQGHSLASIGSWAIHPGGPKILSAVERALGLPPAATGVSRDVLREHGNMSSATVLFLLARLRQTAAPGPTVMLGFGPGIVAEAALWE